MIYTVGTTVFEHWKIVRELGAGANGRVFEIQKTEYGITVKSALKVIQVPKSESDVKMALSEGMDVQSVSNYFQGFVDEIVKEILVMSTLKSHPNIVGYEDHQVIAHEGEIGWDILIRMELLTTLTDYQIQKPMTEADVLRLGREMCSALVFCQKNGLIHRDIKPENIFVSQTGQFKLGDFGVARTVEKTTGGLSRKGTESYMAPEVYLGKPYGMSVDIYSLGLVLYRYTNDARMPFYPPLPSPITFADRENALGRRMAGEDLPAPVGAGGQFADVILKACAYQPENRYHSAAEMLSALNAVEADRLGRMGRPLTGSRIADAGSEEKTVGMGAEIPETEERTVGMDSDIPGSEKTAGMGTDIPGSEEKTTGMEESICGEGKKREDKRERKGSASKGSASENAAAVSRKEGSSKKRKRKSSVICITGIGVAAVFAVAILIILLTNDSKNAGTMTAGHSNTELSEVEPAAEAPAADPAVSETPAEESVAAEVSDSGEDAVNDESSTAPRGQRVEGINADLLESFPRTMWIEEARQWLDENEYSYVDLDDDIIKIDDPESPWEVSIVKGFYNSKDYTQDTFNGGVGGDKLLFEMTLGSDTELEEMSKKLETQFDAMWTRCDNGSIPGQIWKDGDLRIKLSVPKYNYKAEPIEEKVLCVSRIDVGEFEVGGMTLDTDLIMNIPLDSMDAALQWLEKNNYTYEPLYEGCEDTYNIYTKKGIKFTIYKSSDTGGVSAFQAIVYGSNTEEISKWFAQHLEAAAKTKGEEFGYGDSRNLTYDWNDRQFKVVVQEAVQSVSLYIFAKQ